jgi:putative endopeptidase
MFTEKSKLMSIQASKYSFEHNNETFNMNPELTMGENLADLGGLSLGIRTLNTELEKNNVFDKEIIETYHRIFFKSFANIWRQNISDDYRVKLINLDPHAPNDFRANLVNNIDEFYDAFKIIEGDKMFLSKESRLNMW